MSAKSNMGWPSLGFFLLVASHSLLVGLLLWGWQKPPLDEVFAILERRELDRTLEYSPADLRLLQGTWDAHPGFGRALLGKSQVKFLEPTESGWVARRSAHLAVRTEADRPTQFSLEGRGAPGDYPITVKIRGNGLERQVELLPNQSQKIEYSIQDLPKPSILDVEIRAGQSHAATAPTWAVRVTSSPAGTARETP
jgi:hypothetical protein